MKHNGTINNFNHNKALALLTIKNLDAHKKILHGQGARNHDFKPFTCSVAAEGIL